MFRLKKSPFRSYPLMLSPVCRFYIKQFLLSWPNGTTLESSKRAIRLQAKKIGVPRPENGEPYATKGGENPQPSLASPVLNYCPKKQRRSKKFSDRLRLKDAMISRLQNGAGFCETDIEAGRYRGDVFKTMRQIARDYPENAKLVLNRGLWHLTPAKRGML